MMQQLIGLAIHSMGYAERYDLYFNLDKIVFEGQVSRRCLTQMMQYPGLAAFHVLLLHPET